MNTSTQLTTHRHFPPGLMSLGAAAAATDNPVIVKAAHRLHEDHHIDLTAASQDRFAAAFSTFVAINRLKLSPEEKQVRLGQFLHNLTTDPVVVFIRNEHVVIPGRIAEVAKSNKSLKQRFGKFLDFLSQNMTFKDKGCVVFSHEQS